MNSEQNIIIYNTPDGNVSVALYAADGNVWMNQKQLAELFDTSVPNISMHITNILKDKELASKSVIKEYLTTAADGKDYEVTFYSLNDDRFKSSSSMNYFNELQDRIREIHISEDFFYQKINVTIPSGMIT